jgi:hypothetical protein
VKDLEALAKLASELVTEMDDNDLSWYTRDDLVSEAFWGAGLVAAASPSTVLALIRVALAAKAYLEDLGLDWYGEELDGLKAAVAGLA